MTYHSSPQSFTFFYCVFPQNDSVRSSIFFQTTKSWPRGPSSTLLSVNFKLSNFLGDYQHHYRAWRADTFVSHPLKVNEWQTFTFQKEEEISICKLATLHSPDYILGPKTLIAHCMKNSILCVFVTNLYNYYGVILFIFIHTRQRTFSQKNHCLCSEFFRI